MLNKSCPWWNYCFIFCRTFNLKEVLNSIGIQTCVEVNKTLMERGLPALNAEVQANLVGQFSSIEEEDNPIWSLIGEPVYFYWFLLQCQYALPCWLWLMLNISQILVLNRLPASLGEKILKT